MVFSMSGALAALTVEGAGGTGTALNLKYQTASTRGDSLFVAAVVGGAQIFFFDENGQAQTYQPGQPTPYRLRSVAANTLNTLVTIDVPAWVDGTVDFYSVFGSGGGDVLANAGALDMSTLEHVSLNAGPRGTGFVARGKVLDDAASGAVVCIDVNFNRKCDSDEAQATAGADGSFALSTSDTDAARKSMIAVTSAGYVLEAPAGYYAAISPLSTLVQNEIEVNHGTTVPKAAKMVGIEIGVSEDMLTADFVAAQANAAVSADAATAERMARLLSQVWKQVASETGLAAETDARRRAAIVQYSRNLTYKKGWVFHEALNQVSQDPLRALRRFAAIDGTVLSDSLREAKLAMLAQQRYSPEWVTKPVGEAYIGNPWAALSYDPTTNRLTVNMSLMQDGAIKKMDITDAHYTTTALAARTNLSGIEFNLAGANYAVNADGTITVTGKRGGFSTETLSSVDELDMGGMTIKLGELTAFSRAVDEIPEAYNIPVTFQAGDKMWREHHDKTSAPLDKTTFTTKASGFASMEAYILAKNGELSSYQTFGDYEVYFKPTDAVAPLNGEMWAYNKATQSRFKVGTYATRAENGRNYIVVKATTLKGVTGATPTTVIYFDAADSSIKYASWREYVMYCLCWQRKFNVSAMERILAALKAADSVLITPATVASTQTSTHADSGTRAALRTITIGLEPTAEQIALLKQAVCGGCTGGDCGACPVGDVVGLR
jgi:hypothetical protein